MSSYVLGIDADLDLEEIWEYIAADKADAADRWIAILFDAFEAIARSPRIGHRRSVVTPFPVLFWPVEKYLVIYRSDRRPIEIVAVTGVTGIPSFLRRRVR